MKFAVKNKFMLVDVIQTEKSTRVVLGMLDFSGNKTYFIDADKIKVDKLEKMKPVEVEMDLTLKTRRFKEVGKDAEFVDTVTTAIKSIKHV